MSRVASSGSVAQVGAELALELEGVSARYEVKRNPAAVLTEVNLAVAGGELLAVVGPNGAGKSTLLRVLAGTLRPHIGTVRLFGRDLLEVPRPEAARKIAVVAQTNEVAFGFRVEEVVMMGRSPYQRGLMRETEEDVSAVRDAMRKADIEALRDRPVAELSGGEQKLVALARAFAQRPSVLLLDEPSAQLDPQRALHIFELLVSEVRERGLSSIAVVHDLNLAASFADRIVLLVEGRVAATGPALEVLSEENIARAFGPGLGVVGSGGSRYFVPRRGSSEGA